MNFSRRQTLAFAAGGLAFAGSAAAQGFCRLMPQTTEGPFYFDPGLVRGDITDGRPGVALALKLAIVGTDCAPISDARVDVWHCDAQGGYSRMETAAMPFLRGTQFTNGAGEAAFGTIFPGWYRGRTTHVHYKVFLQDRAVMTGQIMFPDEVSERIYAAYPAYARDTARDRTNVTDGIARDATDAAIAEISSRGPGYSAQLRVAVDRV